ncbi:MAG: glycosyltransferase [Candidatus Omnitrophica bacterium]|nr:glycosyltransferase [Candidatus Omnitrophota bacterium]
MNDCRVVVLNFNGESLLKECLPSVTDSARKSKYRCAVTVLDNGSVDRSREVVAKDFPEVCFVQSRENKVLCSYNDYLKTLEEEFVVLLNNDMIVDPGFIDPLLDCLIRDPQAFFSTSKALGADRKTYEGSLSKIGFGRGLVWATSFFKGYEPKIGSRHKTMLCGFGAFRKSFFEALGGYDELYLPGTVEDLDLCYRAYRRGWVGYYCPESVICHLGQVSFKKRFGPSGIRRINRRNLYLFVWKNIRSRRLLAQHFIFLPLQLLKYLCCWQWDFIAGFFQALSRLPAALRRRAEDRSEPWTLADEQIFEISASI